MREGVRVPDGLNERDCVGVAEADAVFEGVGAELPLPLCVPVGAPVADVLGDPVPLGETVWLRVAPCDAVPLRVELRVCEDVATWLGVRVALGVCESDVEGVPLSVPACVSVRDIVPDGAPLRVCVCVCESEGVPEDEGVWLREPEPLREPVSLGVAVWLGVPP